MASVILSIAADEFDIIELKKNITGLSILQRVDTEILK